MRKIYNIVEEPKGKVYKSLLRHALKYCDSFQFVVPHHIQNNTEVQAIINLCKAFLINVKEEIEWPGTKLYEGTATIYSYTFNKESCILLCELANRLYEWVQFNSPEDLCLRRKDGTPWLVSITFEDDAYLELTVEEKEELERAIPDLVLEENPVPMIH